MKFKIVKTYYGITDPDLKNFLESENFIPCKPKRADRKYTLINDSCNKCKRVYFEKTPKLMLTINEYKRHGGKK